MGGQAEGQAAATAVGAGVPTELATSAKAVAPTVEVAPAEAAATNIRSASPHVAQAGRRGFNGTMPPTPSHRAHHDPQTT